MLKSASKKSVTTKTMDAMTSLEKASILDSAEKTLMKQAKKGLRVEALKVCLNFVAMNLCSKTKFEIIFSAL